MIQLTLYFEIGPDLRFYLMKFTYDKIYIFIEMVAFDIPITVDNLGLMLLNIVILSFLDETVCKKKKKAQELFL